MKTTRQAPGSRTAVGPVAANPPFPSPTPAGRRGDTNRRQSIIIQQPGTNLRGCGMTAVAMALLLSLLTAGTANAAQISLESAPPVVVKTDPVTGATGVDPNLTELRVTYSKPMLDRSWSWCIWGDENFPEMTGDPRYLEDRRTCVLPVKLEPGKFYATWLNTEKFRNFQDTNGRPAVPYLLTFTTAPSTAVRPLSPIPNVEDLPGQVIFNGRYRHRSRGRDIDAPSELWIKESANRSLSVLAQLPFSGSFELASGNPEHRLTGYQIWREPSGDRAGSLMALQLRNGTVRLTTRGGANEEDGKELKVPQGAWFDPNTRPDSYCAANILLRAFALKEGEEKEFHVYDWDNRGEGMVDYTIKVRHAGKERVEVPAGPFDANHLVLTQVTSADTWFKKRAGHVTDFWALDNHVIVRVLRHREPYEMMLLDYTLPERLEGSARPSVKALQSSQEGAQKARDAVQVVSDASDWPLLLNDDQKAVIAWTDRQFRRYFDERTFDGWSDEELKTLEARSIDALNGPRSAQYYTAINTLGALGRTNALPRLRELAFERVDKNNRDRWMSVRVLGILGDRQSVPELIHLVYHGNPNTRWWAQIGLVQLTGQNFGGDWEAWGRWWNEGGGRPPYDPEIIRWWDGQAESIEDLKGTLAEWDRIFLNGVN